MKYQDVNTDCMNVETLHHVKGDDVAGQVSYMIVLEALASLVWQRLWCCSDCFI